MELRSLLSSLLLFRNLLRHPCFISLCRSVIFLQITSQLSGNYLTDISLIIVIRLPKVYWIISHLSMALWPLAGPWPLLQFCNFFLHRRRTAWSSDHPVARPLPTHRTKQTHNKRTHRHPCLELDWIISDLYKLKINTFKDLHNISNI
jgi:hypothetical protein